MRASCASNQYTECTLCVPVPRASKRTCAPHSCFLKFTLPPRVLPQLAATLDEVLGDMEGLQRDAAVTNAQLRAVRAERDAAREAGARDGAALRSQLSGLATELRDAVLATASEREARQAAEQRAAQLQQERLAREAAAAVETEQEQGAATLLRTPPGTPGGGGGAGARAAASPLALTPGAGDSVSRLEAQLEHRRQQVRGRVAYLAY